MAELNIIDMNGKAHGVVPVNLGVDSIRKGHARLEHGNLIYFNSGVLLFNMSVWQSENCYQMIIDTLHKKINLDWPDQNLLNNAIPERIIKTLPLKFNYISHHSPPPRQERGWLRIGHYYTEDEIGEAIGHPAIIHYIGGWVLARPWYEHCRSSKRADYMRYKALSPWKDSPIFRAYEEVNPPQGFGQKADYWLMKLQGECPSFRIARTIDIIYYFIKPRILKFLNYLLSSSI